MKIAFLIVLLGLVAMAVAKNNHHNEDVVENIKKEDLLKVQSDVETALRKVFDKMTPSERYTLLRTPGIFNTIAEAFKKIFG